MRIMRVSAICCGCLLMVGLTKAYPQDALQTLERTMTPPAASQEMGYLGMTVDLMAPEGKSVYIVSVTEGGPAEKGGLRADDVILQISGRDIRNLQDLDGVVRQPPGAKLAFKVRRGDVPQRFEVVLAKRSARPGAKIATVDELPAPKPAAPSSSTNAGTPAPRTDGGPTVVQGSRPHLGIRVADAERLSDADKRRFGVEVDTGAVISGVNEGTPAALAGLPIGGVVVSINGRRIGNAQDIVDVVRTFSPGQQIDVTYWEGDRMGRKRVRVGRTAVAVTPAPSVPPEERATAPRLRGRTDRPLLNALERLLDDVLPPEPGRRMLPDSAPAPPPPGSVTDPAIESMVPPPPPPPRSDTTRDLPDIIIDPPAVPPPVELPEPRPAEPSPAEPRAEQEDVDQLRQQAAELQKQLEALLRRIEQLEKKQ